MRRLIFVLVIAGCGNVPKNNSNDMSTAGGGDMAGGGGGGGGDMTSTPTCSAGAACQAGNGNGLCTGGACNACTDMTDDAMCATVYGKGFLCLGGACTQGCRMASDCAAGQQCVANQCAGGCMSDSDCADPATVCNTTTGACVTNASCGAAANGAMCPVNSADLCCGASGICTAVACCGSSACTVTAANDGTCMQGVCVLNSCAAPAGTTRYVDFAAGGGGSGSMSCPFNSITAALTSLSSTGGTVLVKGGAGQMRSVVTHNVGAGITITGTDASFNACTPGTCSDATKWPTVTIGNSRAFNFTTAGNRKLSYLNVVGPGSSTSTLAGVYVAAATVTFSHLYVKGFQYGVYADVGASVTLNAGVQLTNNQTGAFINGGGASTGGSLDAENVGGDMAIVFDSNDVFGVRCEGNGKLKLNAPPFVTGAGTQQIFASSNGAAGVRFYSTLPASITGLIAEGDGKDITQTYRDGLVVFAKSMLKVRGSRFAGNAVNGVHVVANGSNTADGVSGIDLGAAAASDPGANAFVGNTGGAGVCIDPGPANAATNKSLLAEGNTWNNSVSCVAAGGTITRGKTCVGSGADIAANCAGVLDISMCKDMNLPGGCTN